MSTAEETSNKATVRRFHDTTAGDPEFIFKKIDATSLLRGYLHAAGRRRPAGADGTTAEGRA